MRLARWAAAAVVFAPLLSGCGVLAADEDPEFGAPQEAGASGEKNPGNAPRELVNPAETIASSDEVRAPVFGEFFRYGSGLKIQVEAPERFTPSGWIERRPGVPLRLRVTVRNGTEELWNPSQLHVRLASGFVPAEQIFDYDQDVVARPEERVPHGETVTFFVGYWVPDPERLSLEVDPGHGYQTTVVTTR